MSPGRPSPRHRRWRGPPRLTLVGLVLADVPAAGGPGADLARRVLGEELELDGAEGEADALEGDVLGRRAAVGEGGDQQLLQRHLAEVGRALAAGLAQR